MLRRHFAIVVCTGLTVLFSAGLAVAYPSAVILAPSGRVLPRGELDGFALASTELNGPRDSSSWFGANVGLWSGLGGDSHTFALEAGLDFVLRNAADVAPVTPLLNLKLSVAAERDPYPALALGVFELSPYGEANADLIYFAASKLLGDGGGFGDVTTGALFSAAPPSFVSPCARGCAFRGSVPLEDTRWGGFLGWTSPKLGPLQFAFDAVTGSSLVSGANAALTYALARQLHAFSGASIALDRRAVVAPADSVSVGIAWSLGAQ